jgi:hypothetical protein
MIDLEKRSPRFPIMFRCDGRQRAGPIMGRERPVAAVTFSARLPMMWSVMGCFWYIFHRLTSDLTEVTAPGQSFGDIRP